MNIAVITPFDYPNLGAYLQAYCLKMKLEELGHNVYHIPTRSKDFVRRLYYKDKPTRKKEKLFRLTFEKNKRFGKRKYAQFAEDLKEFRVVEDGEESVDLYILGSDEIWNLSHELAFTQVFNKPIFWGIGKDPVITYAPSIGGADYDTLMKYPDKIEAIRKLRAAPVRDGKTADFVEAVTGKKAPIVCDPTILVPIGSYGREFRDDYLKEHDCLLVYVYTTIQKDSIAAIRAYAKQKGLKTVGCCFNHSWCDHICECSPLEFSSLIRQCSAVVTNTFHGSIFSILNHANFVSATYSPKTTQLLEQFGLSDRCLEKNGVTAESVARVLDGEAIDYDAVESRIGAIRESSVQLLSQAIVKAVEP